jgi:hypothetical protein
MTSRPLPRTDDTLNTLGGAKWFSTMDLKGGCWQVALHPDDKEKTAFLTGQGLRKLTLMIFGICKDIVHSIPLLSGKKMVVHLDRLASYQGTLKTDSPKEVVRRLIHEGGRLDAVET